MLFFSLLKRVLRNWLQIVFKAAFFLILFVIFLQSPAWTRGHEHVLHSLTTHWARILTFKGHPQLETMHVTLIASLLRCYKHLWRNEFHIMAASSSCMLLVCLFTRSFLCFCSICAPFCLCFPHTSNTHSGCIQSQ